VKANKLKRRRWRRMRDALAAYKTEASDWKSLYLERTAEIASLRSQRLLVPMPVIVPAEIYNQFKGVRRTTSCVKGVMTGCVVAVRLVHIVADNRLQPVQWRTTHERSLPD
jgi:hypothetical protein